MTGDGPPRRRLRTPSGFTFHTAEEKNQGGGLAEAIRTRQLKGQGRWRRPESGGQRAVGTRLWQRQERKPMKLMQMGKDAEVRAPHERQFCSCRVDNSNRHEGRKEAKEGRKEGSGHLGPGMFRPGKIRAPERRSSARVTPISHPEHVFRSMHATTPHRPSTNPCNIPNIFSTKRLPSDPLHM
jgi:hypothetical protein